MPSRPSLFAVTAAVWASVTCSPVKDERPSRRASDAPLHQDNGAGVLPLVELEREGGEILFVSSRDDSASVLAVGPDGSGRRQVAAAAGRSQFPAEPPAPVVLSVDYGSGEPRSQLLVTGKGEPRALDFTASFIAPPRSAPDGSFIVFEANRDGFRDIYRADLGSGEITRLTFVGDGAYAPVVSPDGKQVAFFATGDGHADIWVMFADGSGAHALTGVGGEDELPAWSADGKQLVFVSNREGADRLFTIDASGGPPVRVTRRDDDSCHEGAPVWSPAGDQIAYELRCASSEKEIWVSSVESARSRRVSRAAQRATAPVWSPGGRFLVYSVLAEGGLDLWVAGADGGGERRLTAEPGDEWMAHWRAATTF